MMIKLLSPTELIGVEVFESDAYSTDIIAKRAQAAPYMLL